MKLSYTVCAVSWKSADLTHIPADLWPLKRYGTCAQFCVYLFEVTHKKDRLSPLSLTNNLLVEFGNHTPTRLAPLSTRPKTVRVEVTRLDPLSKGLQIEPPSWIQTMVCHSLRGVMKIPRYNTNPKTNALIDCIYHSQAPC